MTTATWNRLSKLEAQFGLSDLGPIFIRSGQAMPPNASHRLVMTLKRPDEPGPYVRGISVPPRLTGQDLEDSFANLVRSLSDDDLASVVSESKSAMEAMQ